ncbi:hypothetical protein [Streptomyces mirabilis]|uniref:hypothetical protein n=1 Tax=Streptomyces mirabilis TaxID=68239 RepID=UPI0033DD7018
MATALEPRRLEDLEQDALARIDQERQRRATGLRPWTDEQYVDQIAKIHARYSAWRLALQKWRAA